VKTYVKNFEATSLGEALSQLSEVEKLGALHSGVLMAGRALVENRERLAVLFRIEHPHLSPVAAMGAVSAASEVLMLLADDTEIQLAKHAEATE
jgi:hypothetical protein